MREKWLASFGPDKEVILYQAKNNLYFYITRSREFDGRADVYHVWLEDLWLYCGTDRKKANMIYTQYFYKA